MRNFKIGIKMISCFGIILLLLTVMTGFSLVNIWRMSKMAPTLYETEFTDSVASVQISRVLYRLDGLVMDMVIDKSSATHEQAYAETRSALDTELLTLVDTAGVQESIDQIEAALIEMDASYEKVLHSLSIGSQLQASMDSDVYSKALTSAVEAADRMVVQADESAHAFMSSANRVANQVVILQIVLFVAIFICCIVTGIRLTAYVVRPVKKLATAMDDVAQGKLNIQIDNQDRDELGILSRQLCGTMVEVRGYVSDISEVLSRVGAGDISMEVSRDYLGDFGEIKDSLNQIIAALNKTLSQIRVCCFEVRSGSTSLAANAEMLAQGTAEQSSALDEFQSTMDRVSILTAQDAKNAAQIQRISADAAETVTASEVQMAQMTNSMREIERSSQEIAKVIKIIEDIAFQTNILALNAAVEAARAGTAGKGFAVVADEVRNLASKSAEAAKHTTDMISSAVAAVDSGMRNADASAGTLQQVKNSVEQMEALLAEINKSTAEQSAAFSQMAVSADQISRVVHSNSAAAEENSAAAEQLSAQAETLNNLVDRFQLRTENQMATM